MTPVEKIDAAIAKLEELAKPFSVINGWLVTGVDRCTCAGGHAESNYAHEPFCGMEPVTNDEYSVVMQATVVPQLKILRDAIEEYSPGDDAQAFIVEDALLLADAILGSES
jgi:hypothetical protein